MIARFFRNTFLICLSLGAASCIETEPEYTAPVVPEKNILGTMDASCSVAMLDKDGSIATRSIIGQSSIASLDGNFIKSDEPRKAEWSQADYCREESFSWSENRTRIIDADIMSSPDNTAGFHFRSIVFKPRQTYQYSILPPPSVTQPEDTLVGYVSRMIGWYPKTFEVPVGPDGTPADAEFVNSGSFIQYEENGVIHDCVIFKNKLNGETDVMVSDMREGRIDMGYKGFRNNPQDIDVQPYGHQFKDFMNPSSGFQSCNYFTFNHYLTAVRLFVDARDAELNLMSWKQIDDVLFESQPQTVTISLPTSQARGTSGQTALVSGTTPTLPAEGVTPQFGRALKWEDPANLPIIKTPMAVNDPAHPDFADVPAYPIKMTASTHLNRTFLGYMLVRPDKDTPIQIHTDAGAVSAILPKRAYYINAAGQKVYEDIMKPGHIYDIVITIKTDGSLDAVLGYEDYENYNNLAPFNPKIQDFETSNCYVITPEDMKVPGKDDLYDGFYFPAMTPGRGERGMIQGTSAELYPQEMYLNPAYVEVLWQDQPHLITNVELVHDYVRFSLNPECHRNTNPMTGNAVIAVFDSSKQIIWSWHIWVTDQLRDVTFDKITFRDVEDKTSFDDILAAATANKTLTNVTMMNMNLGAMSPKWTGASDVLKTYGLYYQWGRKDPSPGPPAYNYSQADMSTSPYHYRDQGVRTRVSEIRDVNPTVEMGVRNPLGIVSTTTISETYPNDWLYSSVDQLWGYSTIDKRVVNKTIYDPCPYGYRVADDELWALFYHCEHIYKDWKSDKTSDGYGIRVTDRWWPYDTEIFFPFTGWRGHDRGRTDRTHAWFGVGVLGDYQDARVCKNSIRYSNHRGRSLLLQTVPFTVQDVVPSYTKRNTVDYANRTSASPVRCIKYDKNDEEPSRNQ